MDVLPAIAGDGPALKRLLATAGLPTEDLTDDGLRHFLVVRDGADVVGAVGLEVAGDVALLRSLAVAETARDHGLGGRLTTAAEALATRLGVHSLYLLTTTAAAYFERRGYRVISRGEAPEAIARTSQFSGLCPSSSTFMSKIL